MTILKQTLPYAIRLSAIALILPLTWLTAAAQTSPASIEDGQTQQIPTPQLGTQISQPLQMSPAQEQSLNRKVVGTDPCQDSLYLELKTIPIDEMSDRQFEIFKQKDAACQDYQKTQATVEPANRTAEAAEKAVDSYNAWIWISIIGSVATLIIYLSYLGSY